MNRIVSEVFSPPRVTQAIKLLPRLRLVPGLALDVTRCNDKGEPWDFDDPAKQEEALQLFEEQKPVLLVGSPPCTPTAYYSASTTTGARLRRMRG